MTETSCPCKDPVAWRSARAVPVGVRGLTDLMDARNRHVGPLLLHGTVTDVRVNQAVDGRPWGRLRVRDGPGGVEATVFVFPTSWRSGHGVAVGDRVVVEGCARSGPGMLGVEFVARGMPVPVAGCSSSDATNPPPPQR